MKIGKRTNTLINITGLSIVLIVLLMKLFFHDFRAVNFIRSVIYMIFFTLWTITIRYRAVQMNVRVCLMVVAISELFWLIARTVKYELPKDSDTLMRYLWYLYYLPMLMIPAFCLLLSISMGKPESYRPRTDLLIYPLISAVLFLIVITNDLHSLVFVIPPGPEGQEVGNYSYGAGFGVIVVYIILCASASLGILIFKCRKPGRKGFLFLPVLPLLIDAVILVLNALGLTALFGVFQIDITAVNCFCITATLELCMQFRLIPTNSGYDELFRMSDIRAVITDEGFEPLIRSDTFEDIGSLSAAENEPVILDSGFRLNCVPIKHGRVLWQDDISELNAALEMLAATNDYLSGKSSAIRETYEIQKKERRLIEKNRLYNRILSHTKPEIELYARLVEELAEETDPAREKNLAVKIAFVSGFIKRRDNLVFLSEEEGLIDPVELSYCIEELLSTLRLYGIECSCSNMISRSISFGCISALYESFYRLMYSVIDSV